MQAKDTLELAKQSKTNTSECLIHAEKCSIFEASSVNNLSTSHVLVCHYIFHTNYTISATNSMAQEPEDSSPHSQKPATGPCPETVESNPHPPSQSP
jgi:hypothetical protein